MEGPANTAPGKRVVIVGATGNVGTSLAESLSADPGVDSVVGLARRLPRWELPKTQWVSADVAGELVDHFRGADVVVHLAWLFQPTHDPVTTWRTNVLGSLRVFQAAEEAEVPALVYASSVGAYSPGPKGHAVDESWPTHGWPGAAYTREKAYVERLLDVFERDNPQIRVVRLRTGFVFKREAAQQQRRLVMGPLMPNRLVRTEAVPVFPNLPGLRFQALHTADAAQAYRLAALGSARGAFNVAADPVLDASELGQMLGARIVRVPVRTLRAVIAGAWRMRLIPASPDLFDALLRLPLMDTSRARDELGWEPEYSALDAIDDFLRGLHDSAGMPTGPLTPRIGGGRLREFATGVGKRP